MNTNSLIPVPERVEGHTSTLNLVLTRLFTKGEYTHGSLSIDGIKICSTLENANALVPAGDYQISLVKCKQYSRKMLCLKAAIKGEDSHACLSFPEREQARPQVNPSAPCSKCPKLPFVCMNSTLPCWCPMLKPGNGIHGRLDGSILVGKYNCLNSLIHPKTIFDALYERIRKSLSRGNEVKISIV